MVRRCVWGAEKAGSIPVIPTEGHQGAVGNCPIECLASDRGVVYSTW